MTIEERTEKTGRTFDDLMGLVRFHLEGNDRFSSREVFYELCKKSIPVEYDFFNQTIDEMVKRGLLVEQDGYIRWK